MTRASTFAATAVVALLSTPPASAAAEEIILRGACDGSAGVALDDERFVSADDDSNVLRIYRFDGAGEARTVPLDDFLDTLPKKKGGGREEADIEGAARVGDRIYWIASHSRSKEGEKTPDRLRFFATDILPGPTLKEVGNAPYRGLLDDMLADAGLASLKLASAYRPDEEKAKDRRPEGKDGFNIEGLAAAPNSQRLLIAFRNPIRNGAIIVPFENPAEVIAGQGKTKPVFGAPIELQGLGGRGIRSIDYIAGRFVIVAGPYGDPKDKEAPKPPFKLFSWSGKKEEAAQPLPVEIELVENKFDPEDVFGPEAVFESPKEGKLVLLYDEGDRMNEDKTRCKKAGEEAKSFTGKKLPLPRFGDK